MAKTLVRNLNRALGALAAAARAADAVERHRTPRRQDLQALGIDPVAYGTIGR